MKLQRSADEHVRRLQDQDHAQQELDFAESSL